MLNFINHPLTGTPYGTALDLCVVVSILAWLTSVITREYSWADRLWSLCPPIYCLIVAADADFASPRLNLMAVLVTLWGLRLTYNYARKGGFSKGGEDYRWAAIHEKIGPVGFQALNLVFIAPGQMLIVWLFASPVHQAWLWRETPLSFLDGIAAAVFVVFFIGEWVADEQMWRFQQGKKRKIDAGEEVTRPFVTTGLFAWCRHPNFFCEMGMWWVFYLFAVGASGVWFNWTGLGFVVLTLLFHGSTQLTESLTLAKYPAYRDYQATTPRLMPLPFLRRAAGRPPRTAGRS